MSAQKKQLPKKDTAGIRSIGAPKYVLRLFVSGILHNSVRAIANINRIGELHLKGDYKLEIIDIYQQPDLAISEQVIVIPVMIVKYPLPERRIIGDLSNVEKVLEILNCK
jgi:circadian clock protein KaiB